MTTLTEKFTALEEQLSTENATIAGYIDTVEAKLQLIADEIDTMSINAAANTKALLGALSQSAACFPCPTPSIVVPPIGTTPIPINTEACQRSQAFLATIADILTAMDTLQSFNVIGTFNVLNDAISEVISGIAAGDTVPLPSFPETVQIVGTYVNYAGERLFSGVGLMEQFSPLVATLRSALYAAGAPDSARSQYEAVIDGSSASSGAKFLFKAVAYTALYSYFFDDSTLPDLSGFDGGICTLPTGTCYEFELTLLHYSNGATLYGLADAFGPFTPVDTINTSSGPISSDVPCFFDGDASDWTCTLLSGACEFKYRAGDLSSSGLVSTTVLPGEADPPLQLPSGGCFLFEGTSAPSIRLCYNPA